MVCELREYPWVNGLRFLARPGMAGIVKNIYTGLADFSEMAFLLHFLRSEDLFVDVGANVGSYTLLASGVCRARSIAVEPIPSSYEVLNRNLQLNDLQTLVTVHGLGIGSEADTLFFTTELDALNRVIEPQQRRGVGREGVSPIRVVTLDELLARRRANLVKVDVEGYELEVLKGAREVLTREDLKCVIIEMVHAEDLAAIHTLLVKNGFSPGSYDPFSRSIAPMDDFNHDRHNTLYLRDMPAVQERVETGTEFSVLGISL